MERPTRFEHTQYLGDKRDQVVHDVDACDAPERVTGIVEADAGLCFGPDTVAEARNRGYELCRACPGVRAAHPAGR